jgi:hypothetical protein
MQYQIECRSKGRKALIDSLVRVLIPELRLTRSRFNLLIRTDRGLAQRDGMRGVVGPDLDNPMSIIMLLDSALDQELLIDTLCHEMVHVKQFALGQAQVKYRGEKPTFYWLGRRVQADYWDQPWEQEAWRRERVLASRIYKILAG